MTITELTNDNYNDILSGVVLIDFYAPWCKPCIKMIPELEKANEQLKNNISIVKANVETVTDIATRFGVSSLPTLVLQNNGKIISCIKGYKKCTQIIKFVNNGLANI